jgi:threonine dehydrogenase-like Zn-dependent dehydrogenase
MYNTVVSSLTSIAFSFLISLILTMADSTRPVIYLSPEGPVLKDISEQYQPTGTQSLLRVEYSGINPADIKHAGIGLHSSVAGYDIAGEVLEVAPGSPFKPGDKIFGINGVGRGRPMAMGAHQDYAIAASNFWHRVPPEGSLNLSQAATLPVMTMTAADGLFNILGLAFQEVGIQGSESQSLLIWGGASTVGLAAVQLAKAAGHGPIFVTASTKNHDTLKSLGADYCFDYKDADVVEQIKNAIRASGKPVCHGFATVGMVLGAFTEGDESKKSTPAMTAMSMALDEEGDRDVKLVCVLPVKNDPRYKMVFATRDPDSDFEMARVADPEAWNKMQRGVMNWVIGNFGKGKYIGCPNITIVKGAKEGLEAMARSAEGKCSLEKIAIEHPL